MDTKWPFLLLAFAAFVLIIVLLAGKPSGPNRPGGTSATGKPTPESRDTSARGKDDGPPWGDDSPHADRTGDAVTRRLNTLLAELEKGVPRSRVLQLVSGLKRMVHSLPPEQAAAALIAFLETGRDSSTGLSFEPGPEGVMEETPTLRTAAIDLLGQTDPRQSVDYARRILRSTDSPDEYALAMRNLGWSFPGLVAGDELAGAFRAMLGRPAWSNAPSRGFLEAFDIAVVAESASDVVPLLQNKGPGSEEPPLSRAAFVALDRIMLRNPGKLVELFANNPAFMSQTPFHRASLMTRMDPRVPAQRQLLASYILRGDHASGELDYFAGVFPNANRFSSFRLVSGAEQAGGLQDQENLDRAVRETLEEWSVEPRFAGVRDTMQVILQRLR